MKNQLIPILIISVGALSGASANLFFKKASSQILEIPLYQNWPFFIGLGLFSVVLFLFTVAYRLGGETTVVYPAYATTYIWLAILSSKYEGAEISKTQIFGMLFVILGVSMIGMGFKSPAA
jgi:drug/metabolite transporter (DMT)-like permease